MKNTHVILIAALAGAAGIVACEGGPGVPFDLGSSYENLKGSREQPGQNNQDPSPGSSSGALGGTGTGGSHGDEGVAVGSDAGNGSGNGSGNGTGNGKDDGNAGTGTTPGGGTGTPTTPGAGCAPCDATFNCTQGDASSETAFATSGGSCVGPGGITLVCGGAVTQNGNNIGSWTASGNGFAATIGTEVTTCTK